MVLLLCSCVLTSFWLGLFYLQNIEEDYGMFVWPCSVILAEYVWQQRSRFSASRVVEVLLLLIFVFVQILIHQSPMWSTCYCHQWQSILARMSQGLGIILNVSGWKILSLWNSCTHTLLFDGTMLQLRSYLICTYHLQLGAGTSLPGLVAAKVGADVTLTEIAQNTEVSSNSNPS